MLPHRTCGDTHRWGRSFGREDSTNTRRTRLRLRASILIGVVSSSLACLSSPATAARLEATAVDPNDTGHALDIRSATFDRVSHDDARVTIVFWNRVRPSLLRDHAARAVVSFDRRNPSVEYVLGFVTNDEGRLRALWGEGGSSCCGAARAFHPNAVTYTGEFPVGYWWHQSPLYWLRGETARFAHCHHESARRCRLFRGPTIDRTKWVRFPR
jgi:hypothetical protein